MRTTERLKAQRSEIPWEEVNGDNSWRKVKTKGQKEMKRIRKLCEKKPKRRIENQSYKAKVRSKGQRPEMKTLSDIYQDK